MDIGAVSSAAQIAVHACRITEAAILLLSKDKMDHCWASPQNVTDDGADPRI